MLVILNTTLDSSKNNYKCKIKHCYNEIHWVAKQLDLLFLIEKEQKLSTAYFTFQKKGY